MKLILRRKKKQDPTPLERAARIVKLGGHGLTAQRVARKTHKNVKRTKRLAVLGGLAAIGATVAKKVRGGGGTPSTTPPTPTAAPSGAPAGTTATAAATAATGTSPVADTAPASGPDVGGALDDAGVEGDGPDTPKEAAAPGVGDESTSAGAPEAAPPADAGGTEEALGVEAPNQSTPPPPESVKKK